MTTIEHTFTADPPADEGPAIAIEEAPDEDCPETQCDICDNERVIRAGNGGATPCPYCSTPITIDQRFTHFAFGTGTVIAITDDEQLNVQVKFDSPSRFGSKFWFDAREVVRPTPTLDTLIAAQTQGLCLNCGGTHRTWRCPEIGDATVPLTAAELGAQLCGMLWCDPPGFVRLLSRSTPARRAAYASAYVAFLRQERGWCDLTIRDVLARWLPSAPAQQVAA